MRGDEDRESLPVTECVVFRGRVQGVGFRYTTRRLARGYPVTGYVKNLSDGTVELVAQGEAGSVTAFVQEICRVMEGYITAADRCRIEPGEHFGGFSIRR